VPEPCRIQHECTVLTQANAQPTADAAKQQVDAAAASVEKNIPVLADKAAEDITNVAGAVGDSTRQAAADISKTVEEVAKDIEARVFSSQCSKGRAAKSRRYLQCASSWIAARLWWCPG